MTDPHLESAGTFPPLLVEEDGHYRHASPVEIARAFLALTDDERSAAAVDMVLGSPDTTVARETTAETIAADSNVPDAVPPRLIRKK